MNHIASRLTQLLEIEFKSYAKLHTLLEEEQDALIHWQVGELKEIVQRKDQQLQAIQRLEEKRIRFLDSVYDELEKVGLQTSQDDPLTLTHIIRLLKPAEAKDLKELRVQLAELVKDVTTMNYKNQVLLKRSLEIVNANLNIYTQSEKLARTYNATGKLAESRKQHLIDGAV